MKPKKVILLIMLLLLGIVITYYATAPQRAIQSAHRAIPEGVQFYEDNIEFFDLLLDIRNSVIEYNASNDETISTLRFNIFFGHEFRFRTSRVKPGTTTAFTGENPDFITEDDLLLIETTLRMRQRPDGTFIGASVSERGVNAHGFFGDHHRNVSGIGLMSPVGAAEWSALTSRWREYTVPLNQDWSIIFQIRFQE
jgi:hypothetical protein